jgi:hypothetical protein
MGAMKSLSLVANFGITINFKKDIQITRAKAGNQNGNSREHR